MSISYRADNRWLLAVATDTGGEEKSIDTELAILDTDAVAIIYFWSTQDLVHGGHLVIHVPDSYIYKKEAQVAEEQQEKTRKISKMSLSGKLSCTPLSSMTLVNYRSLLHGISSRRPDFAAGPHRLL